MTDHQDCKRATYDPTGGSEHKGGWHCYHGECKELLASVVPGMGYVYNKHLVPLARRDDLPTFGLPEGEHTQRQRWHDGRPTGQRVYGYRAAPRLPIFVYCPRRGCRRGQHLHHAEP